MVSIPEKCLREAWLSHLMHSSGGKKKKKSIVMRDTGPSGACEVWPPRTKRVVWPLFEFYN